MIKGRAQLTIGSSSWLRNTLKSVKCCVCAMNLSDHQYGGLNSRVPRSGASLMSIITTSLVMNTPCVTKTIFFSPDPASNKAFCEILSFEEAFVVVSFWAYLHDVTLSGCYYYCYFWLLFFELLPKVRPPWRLGVFGSVPAQSFPYQVHKKFEKNPRLKWWIIQFQGSTCKVIAK